MAGILAFGLSWPVDADAEVLADPSLSSLDAPSSAEKEARRSNSQQEVLGPESQIGRLVEDLPELAEKVLATPSFRIRGRLRSRERKLELGGRQIFLHGHQPAVTKADGSFEFEDIRDGRIALRVSGLIVLDLPELRKRYLSFDTPEGSKESRRTGAPAVSGGLRHWSVSSISVVVSMANPDQFLEIDVRSMDRVSGQVLFAGVERRPVVGARVRLMQVDDWFEMVSVPTLDTPKTATRTDLNGAFELRPWESGHWFVDVFADGFPMTRVEVVVGGEQALAPLEIHLAKIDFLVEAQLEGGTDLGGISVAMVAASAGSNVAGMALVADLTPESSRTGKLIKGRCVFRGLAPGNYWLKIGEEHAPFLVVGGHQRRMKLKSEPKTQHLRFKLKRAFQHVAKLQFEGKNVSPGAHVVLAYRDGSGRTISTSTSSWGIVTVTLDQAADLRVQSVRGYLRQKNGASSYGKYVARPDDSLKVFGSEQIKARGPHWGFNRSDLIIPLHPRPN